MNPWEIKLGTVLWRKPRGRNFIKQESWCARCRQEPAELAERRQRCCQAPCPAPPRPPWRDGQHRSCGSRFAPARVHRNQLKCHRANISWALGAAPRPAGEQGLFADIARRGAAEEEGKLKKDNVLKKKIIWLCWSVVCFVLSYLFAWLLFRVVFCFGVTRLAGLLMSRCAPHHKRRCW